MASFALSRAGSSYVAVCGRALCTALGAQVLYAAIWEKLLLVMLLYGLWMAKGNGTESDIYERTVGG